MSATSKTSRKRLPRRLPLAVLAALLAIAIATVAGGPAAASPSAEASATRTVTIKGLSFKPASLTVSRGTTVRWVNKDSERHTATRRGAFNRVIKPGKAASVRFGQRGTFPYICTIHPFMKGKIVVR